MRTQNAFLVLLALLSSACPLGADDRAATVANRPNIVLFLVDDMGWQDTSLPFYYRDGKAAPTFLNRRYRTPNMERLAARGKMFTAAYAQAVCTPSRCSLLSGMNAARHHVTNWAGDCDKGTDSRDRLLAAPDWAVNGIQPAGTPASGTTPAPITEAPAAYAMRRPFTAVTPLPALLRALGYATIHCGKAHFGATGTPGANPKNFGFDTNIAGSGIGSPSDYRGSKRYGAGRNHVPGLDENNYYKDDVFLTEALTREALKRLDAHRADPAESKKPFFLYFAHYAIHSPHNPDKRFIGHYPDPQDGRPWSDQERNYAALIEGMDKSLGDLLDYLDRNKLAEDTYVIFMSDNGGLALRRSGRLGDELSNCPLTAGKGSGYEGGIREPMIVAGPGVKAGTRTDIPVIIEDFFPTILALAGAAKPPPTAQTVDGRSFAPILFDGEVTTDWTSRPLLFHFPNFWGEGDGKSAHYGPFTAMRMGDLKLIFSYRDRRFLMFDVDADPGEKHDLAAERPEDCRLMKAVMRRTLKERGAQLPVDRATGRPVALP